MDIDYCWNIIIDNLHINIFINHDTFIKYWPQNELDQIKIIFKLFKYKFQFQ
jgi:hypothetical protein